MDILDDIFKNSLLENEKNVRFWEDYLKNLNSLDFSVYSNKLCVPILVPIGNKILFRGVLKHTNEVLVPLGADYFTRCSISQAEVLKQHRIKDAKSKLDSYKKEKEYLENQISFSKENVYDNSGHEIIETCTEEEDKAWRAQHREKVRQYYQSKKNTQQNHKGNVSDEELWLRLEELEMQEEMENELDNVSNTKDLDESDASSYDSFIIKEDDVTNIEMDATKEESVAHITHNIPKQTSKIDLLHQVIDRQKMLETKLRELKNRERVQSKTENDLLARLDEIEQLDELEDEMERLDDILEDSDVEANDNIKEPLTNTEGRTKIKRSVSFADDDDTNTLEITFKHSDTEPCNKPYNPEKGVVKPSDIYQIYSNLFINETASILRKSKYENNIHKSSEHKNLIASENFDEKQNEMSFSNSNINRTIVVNDVVEKTIENESKIEFDKRPTSLFKKRRQKQKS